MYDNGFHEVGFTYLAQMKLKAWFWKNETGERHCAFSFGPCGSRARERERDTDKGF